MVTGYEKQQAALGPDEKIVYLTVIEREHVSQVCVATEILDQSRVEDTDAAWKRYVAPALRAMRNYFEEGNGSPEHRRRQGK